MNCEEFLERLDLLLDARDGRTPPAGAPGGLDPERHAEMTRHAEECPSCREEAAGCESLARAFRSLPVLQAPRRVVLPPGRAPSVRRGRGLGVGPILVAAAAAILVSASLARLLDRPPARAGGLLVETAEGWRPAGALLSPGDRIRAAEGWGQVSVPGNVDLHLQPGARARWSGPGRVFLEHGLLAAVVRPGSPFVVETPGARVEVKGTVFGVRVMETGGSKERKELQLNENLKTAIFATAVSVVVSTGTVMVHNSLGSSQVGSGEMARVEPGSPPEVVRISEALEGLRKDLAESRQEVQELRSASAERARTVEARVEELAKAAEASRSEERGKEAKEAVPDDPQARLEKIAERFDELSEMGVAAYMHPRLAELSKKVRDMGDDGRRFVADELRSEKGANRFLAAALAEKLKDPALVKPLEDAALKDDDFMVRRMSSHALAFMEDAAAGDALLRIVQQESRDGGVRVNAWYGLAALKRPEAAQTFERVLDEAGGDIPPDFVVDTALKVSDPNLLPELQKAFGKESVSKNLKSRILGTLGKSPGGEYGAFLQKVSTDPAVDADLRKAAEKALQGE